MRSTFAVAALLVAISASQASARYESSNATERARALLYRKDYQAALLAVEKALAAQPNEPIAITTRGQIYTELGEYQLAMADHDRVLKMAPNDPGALNNACWVRALANTDLETAAIYCERAVETKKSLSTLDTRGFLRLRQNDFSAAEEDYIRAIRAGPRTASSLYGRGIARLGLGKVKEGQADLTAAAKLQKDIAKVYEKRGIRP